MIVQARATARHVEHQSRAQSHEARSGDHIGLIADFHDVNGRTAVSCTWLCRGQGHQGTVHPTSLSTCRSTLGPSMCLRFFLAQIAPCCTQHLWRLWSTTRSTRQVSHRHSPVRHSAKLWCFRQISTFLVSAFSSRLSDRARGKFGCAYNDDDEDDVDVTSGTCLFGGSANLTLFKSRSPSDGLRDIRSRAPV